MKTLVIDRKKWLRGEGADKSKLLRKEDGKMCCLGFFGLTCGFTKEEIKEEGKPWKGRGWPKWLFNYKRAPGLPLDYPSSDSFALMESNDDTTLTKKEREESIKEFFARNKVNVEFIN